MQKKIMAQYNERKLSCLTALTCTNRVVNAIRTPVHICPGERPSVLITTGVIRKHCQIAQPGQRGPTAVTGQNVCYVRWRTWGLYKKQIRKNIKNTGYNLGMKGVSAYPLTLLVFDKICFLNSLTDDQNLSNGKIIIANKTEVCL